MTGAEVRSYMLCLVGVHGGVAFFALGVLIAAIGLPVVGVPLLALGVLAFTLAVVTAAVGALRRRGAKPWFGPNSVMEELNEHTGWALLPEAAKGAPSFRAEIDELAAWTSDALRPR